MINVLKADGTTEQFKVQKLRRSLKRAGASNAEINEISREINSELVEGIKTEVIYRRAFELLREQKQPTAARYSLRRALFNLGPTGFPFEDFLARLFEAEGYKTTKRIELSGKCVTHELDVIAYKPGDCLLVEAKFHSHPGVKSDLQVVLYSNSRFLDLENKKPCKGACGIRKATIVTNTKFTSTAVKYANCVGIDLLSWSYPKGNTLQDRIENAGIYPITALSTLSLKNKQALIRQDIILCKEILDKRDILRSIGCSKKKIQAILGESRTLCGK